MADSSSKNNPQDPAQKSLGDVLLNLPAVRAAKKVNTLSRVHRRLIEPMKPRTVTTHALRFSIRFSVRLDCPIAIPVTTCANGDGCRARRCWLFKLAKSCSRVKEPSSMWGCRGEQSRVRR
jgi:hypothetical protein